MTIDELRSRLTELATRTPHPRPYYTPDVGEDDYVRHVHEWSREWTGALDDLIKAAAAQAATPEPLAGQGAGEARASAGVSQRLTLPPNVFVRTVTHYYVGAVVSATERWLTLTRCSWVADTGRWHIALRDGTLEEVEPYPAEDRVDISMGAIVDIAPWHHALPDKAV